MRINPDEVRKLAEVQTIEFKKSLSLRKEALKALCGMINSDSATGVVFFGVSPDGSISAWQVHAGMIPTVCKGCELHSAEYS